MSEPEYTPLPESSFKNYNRGYKLAEHVLDRRFEQHTEGAEFVTPGAGIYLMNHQKFWDSVILAHEYTKVTGEPMSMVAQREFFTGEGIRRKDGTRHLGRTIKYIVNTVGAIPADRSGTRAGLNELTDNVKRILDQDIAIGVHPDATRSENGMINKFFPFFARIAIEGGYPLHGVAQHYSEAEDSRKKRSDTTFLKPATKEEFTALPYRIMPIAQRVKHFNSEVERNIALAAGLEQSHEYAERVRPKD